MIGPFYTCGHELLLLWHYYYAYNMILLWHAIIILYHCSRVTIFWGVHSRRHLPHCDGCMHDTVTIYIAFKSSRSAEIFNFVQDMGCILKFCKQRPLENTGLILTRILNINKSLGNKDTSTSQKCLKYCLMSDALRLVRSLVSQRYIIYYRAFIASARRHRIFVAKGGIHFQMYSPVI